jgi:hypothetical protein
MTLHLTGDAAADTLLSEDPFALLLGMLLDQQIAMETAFAGPAKIRDRIGTLDPAALAGYDTDASANRRPGSSSPSSANGSGSRRRAGVKHPPRTGRTARFVPSPTSSTPTHCHACGRPSERRRPPRRRVRSKR